MALGPGIDVCGPWLRSGGYLIGPGSVVGGVRYASELDAPVAALPGWIGSRLSSESANTCHSGGDDQQLWSSSPSAGHAVQSAQPSVFEKDS